MLLGFCLLFFFMIHVNTSLTAPLFIFKCQNHPRIERVSIYPLVSLTILEHLSSPPVFCEVRFTRSLVLCAWFVTVRTVIKMKNKIDHSVRTVIRWKIKYTTPFELSYPFDIFKLFLPTILWQCERCGIFCLSFYYSSNGVVYFVFHFMTVRTVWYIIGAVKLVWITLSSNKYHVIPSFFHVWVKWRFSQIIDIN
jgi:hypothetical protein